MIFAAIRYTASLVADGVEALLFGFNQLSDRAVERCWADAGRARSGVELEVVEHLLAEMTVEQGMTNALLQDIRNINEDLFCFMAGIKPVSVDRTPRERPSGTRPRNTSAAPVSIPPGPERAEGLRVASLPSSPTERDTEPPQYCWSPTRDGKLACNKPFGHDGEHGNGYVAWTKGGVRE